MGGLTINKTGPVPTGVSYDNRWGIAPNASAYFQGNANLEPSNLQMAADVDTGLSLGPLDLGVRGQGDLSIDGNGNIVGNPYAQASNFLPIETQHWVRRDAPGYNAMVPDMPAPGRTSAGFDTGNLNMEYVRSDKTDYSPAMEEINFALRQAINDGSLSAFLTKIRDGDYGGAEAGVTYEKDNRNAKGFGSRFLITGGARKDDGQKPDFNVGVKYSTSF